MRCEVGISRNPLQSAIVEPRPDRTRAFAAQPHSAASRQGAVARRAFETAGRECCGRVMAVRFPRTVAVCRRGGTKLPCWPVLVPAIGETRRSTNQIMEEGSGGWPRSRISSNVSFRSRRQ